MSPYTHLFVLISPRFRLSVCQLVCIYSISITLSQSIRLRFQIVSVSLYLSLYAFPCLYLSLSGSLRLSQPVLVCWSRTVSVYFFWFPLFSSSTTLPESLFFYTQRLRNIGYLPTIDSSLKIYTQFLNSCYNLFSKTLITFSTKSKC